MKEGYMVNPDDAFAKGQKKRIKSNGGYCLNKDKSTKKNKCPCSVFEDTGECECGLYIRSSFDEGWEE